MIAIPAIDLREGACVQLVGGSYDDERVRIADPLEAAARWTSAGFRRLHVVDLDAATGSGTNAAIVHRLIGESGAEVQVGGGVRSRRRVRELLAAGAASVVLGTRGIEDGNWLCGVARDHPGRIIVAADVRGRSVVTHGWARDTSIDVVGLLESFAELPLAGVLVTAVHCEGRMHGTDTELMRAISEATKVPVVASGGISSVHELRCLARMGVAAAVLGMSLYTGALDARAVATEFGK